MGCTQVLRRGRSAWVIAGADHRRKPTGREGAAPHLPSPPWRCAAPAARLHTVR